jgi:hypothetical protein
MAFEIDRIREIAERVAASSGLEVVDIEVRGGGKARMLRVFLDKPAAASDMASGVICGVTHEPGCGRRGERFLHAGSFIAGAGS